MNKLTLFSINKLIEQNY